VLLPFGVQSVEVRQRWSGVTNLGRSDKTTTTNSPHACFVAFFLVTLVILITLVIFRTRRILLCDSGVTQRTHRPPLFQGFQLKQLFHRAAVVAV
jgi:hypothetical protein